MEQLLFLFSKLFWWVMQPSKIGLLLLVLGVIMLYTRLWRTGRALLSVVLVVVALVSVLPVQVLIAGGLEQRIPFPESLPEHVDGIIVLGGSMDETLSDLHGQVILNYAAERLTQAAALAQRYPEATLLFSGGSALIIRPVIGKTEANLAEAFFEGAGIRAPQLVIEDESRNTYENVRNSQQLMAPSPDEVWIVVTSALHMPRALGIFQKHNWPVIPYPVDYQTTGRINVPHLSLLWADKLSIIDRAAKEWVGLIAYYMLGRTSQLLPTLEL